MKKFLLLAVLFPLFVLGQKTISGRVVDNKQQPLEGANIYIDGSYDGATSDKNGDFSFETTEKGSQKLMISLLKFDTFVSNIVIEQYAQQTFTLIKSFNELDAVVINAGSFDAGEKARVSVLKPLDIVTTAGSNGNIVAALQTLPGTNNVGEDGRLFVRGGEADETQTYIDGIRVAQPYGSTTQNLPTRGRFSPFLFSGLSFSTGGYSAEYGEALSSVLLLNTKDESDNDNTQISAMTVGLGLAKTKKWKTNSITVNAAYIDLKPYQAVIPQNVEWNKPFRSFSGETVFRQDLAGGLFKFYAAFDVSTFDLIQESINAPYKFGVNLKNNNLYLNSSYRKSLGDGWVFNTGFGYGNSKNNIQSSDNLIDNTENAFHYKLKFKKNFSEKIKLSFGTDYFMSKYSESFSNATTPNTDYGFTSKLGAVYTELDMLFSTNFGVKIGLRASRNELLNQNALMPRLSFGYKIGNFSQFSLAYGNFVQAPKTDYLKFDNNLSSEKADHYIFNFQFAKDKRTLRTEIYYKNYDQLVKYDTSTPTYNSVYNNTGNGFAKGFELFYRDNRSIKNFEYWLSYSYIDTKRDYKNYTSSVTPSFVSNHTLSLVGKYFITDWKSQVSLTNSLASGRPYNDPNETTFMSGKTKTYESLSFSWAYLLTTQKILYFSMTNILNTQNVFGYEYANTKTNDIYERRAIIPTADRFFFVGFFWTISSDKSKNQLENL